MNATGHADVRRDAETADEVREAVGQGGHERAGRPPSGDHHADDPGGHGEQAAPSSIRMERPTALRACRVAGPAAAAPSRRRSAAYTPRTKPMNSPTTGMTKKPTMPSTPPPAGCGGTPAALRRRPGTTYFTTVPSARKAAATAKTSQPVEVLRSIAHSRIPPRTSSRPGITGTMMPAMPTASSDGDDDFGDAHGASLPQGAGRDERPPTACRGPFWRRWVAACQASLSRPGRRGLELVRLVVHVGRDRAELVSVFARVVGAEEQLTAGLELDTQVGLGTTTVTAVARRQGGWEGAMAVVTSASFLSSSVSGPT